MKYLFVNSATTNLEVAILIDGKITYLYDENVGQNTSSKLMPTVEEAFKKSNIKPRDIDKVFVVNGPGSFTGIRVGLTVCKTLSWTLKIPVVPISSLEVMASGFDENVISLIDARRGYVYAGGYDKDLNNIYEDRYTLLENVEKNNKYVSYDSFSFSTAIPKLDVKKIINKHKDETGINPHTLNPNYLKLTEAEEKRLNDKKS